MQPLRLQPHLAALAATAMLFLLVAGLVVAKAASHGSRPVAPGTFVGHAR
jgi:hypothetical protein